VKSQKNAVNQYLIESVLSKVREGEIAIPEIQRPFVWDASQVRDLLNSLNQGFPVGYLIAWRSPDVKLKEGSTASGKMILIDGQQRITTLTAAVLGQLVINKKMSWLHNDSDDLYDPTYNDLLRVAFTSEFGRGKLADLVTT
jgi:hypothetical protein